MINLTKSLQIILSGEELSKAVIRAIESAKQCVKNELFSGSHISIDEITTGSKNPMRRASIFKFFEDHDDPQKAPSFDEKWVQRLHDCCYKAQSLDVVAPLFPVGEKGLSWINRSYLNSFKADALLIMHYLWVESAVLLPMELKLPTTKNTDTGGQTLEYAAADYPEMLAVVRKPFVEHTNISCPDISSVIPHTSIDNFAWYAWRLIRATNWLKVEDININDLEACIEHFKKARKKEVDFYTYPIAPKAMVSYLAELFPERCNVNPTDPKLRNVVRRATKSAIDSGNFHISENLRERYDKWHKYQSRYVSNIKSRGLKSWQDYEKSLGILNSYLFDEIPSVLGESYVPEPIEFSRKYIEGHDGIPSFSDFIRKGRKGSTVKVDLYKIDAFLEYLESSSTSDSILDGFINPIVPDIDYPIVGRSKGSVKKPFRSAHFIPLLQYAYAIEAFGWYLSKKIYEEAYKPLSALNSQSKVYDTAEHQFIPVVFLENPSFDPERQISRENSRLRCVPIHFIPKAILPLMPRILENKKEGFTSLPLLNHIQQTILALETGIRNIHIRWLDRRNYDKFIDRSRPLDPICDLWVNTDKSHGPWVAKVSENVIKLIDRQIETHTWFDEPSMHEELWYDDHEDSPFGKVLTAFPRGLAAGVSHGELPGPFTDNTHAEHFSKLIFCFDIFCRYSLEIEPSNAMHEDFVHIKSVDTAEEWKSALKLMSEGVQLIGHTPHSCRVTVVSEYIKILPPQIIGDYITGHSTVAHVIYYAKCDPEYLHRHKKYQKLAIENGFEWDETAISQCKAEDINSKLRKAFEKDRKQASIDFGATSFDRSNDKEVLSGIRALNEQPLDSISFLSTHICPFGTKCPKEVISDLNAIPGKRMPCGSCYYSVKTVDHLPRITGHIRSLVDELNELDLYIKEAKKNGASTETLLTKDEERRFIAAEISGWTVTVHCLEQMYHDIKSRDHFLVEKPEIVTERLEKIVVKEDSLESLLARVSEAKSHAEFFTPQLKHQVKAARNKLLAFTHDINALIQEEPKGFELIDEFRGLIRSTCEALGLTTRELANELERPMNIQPGRPQSRLAQITDVRRGVNA